VKARTASKRAVVTRRTAKAGQKKVASARFLECPNCHRKFERRKKNQKFCSAACRVKHWQFSNAGQRIIADHENRLRAVESGLRAIEAKLGIAA